MNHNLDKVSLGLFILVICLFFLPFAGFEGFITLSGFNIAVGIEEVDPQPLASAAMALAVVGAGLFFWKARSAQILQIAVGVLGGALLIILKITVDQESHGELPWLYGFYLAIVAFFAAAAVNLFAGKNTQPALSRAPGFTQGLRCPNCNSENDHGNNWCEVCGSALRGSNIISTHAVTYNNVSAAAAAAATAPVPEESHTQPLSTPGQAEAAEGRTMPLAADRAPQPAPGQLAFLRVQRVGRWELIPVLKNVFVIGSAQGSTDYQEHSGNLGHIHARIEKTTDGFGITKLGTDNVVYVNDKNLTDDSIHPLRAGDLIRLNNIEYIFDLA